MQVKNKRKVLYLTNIEVPYRTRFFNELAKEVDLTVVYERKKSRNRNADWANGEQPLFRRCFLQGIHIGNENAFSLGLIKHIMGGYDTVVVGCYNSPVQMLAILWMRLFKIPYVLNLDGEIFFTGNGLKNKAKQFFLRGAHKYLIAGEKAAESLRNVVGDKEIYPYYFSSLTEAELQMHRATTETRNSVILVVGQYAAYKGMDIALQAARKDPTLQYLFVGMGSAADKFMNDHDIPENIKIIPFLQKQDLEKLYQSCGTLVLPSRQECWGLVINEAASFGMPIVSTWGSGAAVEFLSEQFSQYLAEPDDPDSLLRCVQLAQNDVDRQKYSQYLLEKSKNYSIEKNVEIHLLCL